MALGFAFRCCFSLFNPQSEIRNSFVAVCGDG